jgi:hypothetical protein
MAQLRHFAPIKKVRNWFGRMALQASPYYTPPILPTDTPASYLTDVFADQINKLSVRGKQLLMMHLYADRNFFVERLVDYLVDPIIGRRGIQISCDTETASKTSKYFQNYAQFNHLLQSKWQRAQLKDALLTGERCYLRVWNPDAGCSQLIQVHATTIRNIIVDPGNYNEPIIVEMEQADGRIVQLRIITDQRRLTREGKQLQDVCKFECYLFQNRKRNSPTLSTITNDPLRKYELRGEPYLMNSADLLEALVKYLWSSLDKADSWNRFNYLFQVDVSHANTQAQAEKEIQAWKTYIGTPKPNSAIYLPKDIISMEPVSFAMQSQDLTQLYRMFRNAAGWFAGSRESALGEGEVRYASTQSPGVEEPSVAQKENLQGDVEEEYEFLFQHEGEFALGLGLIPKKELIEKDPVTFPFIVTSNEISKTSQVDPTAAFESFVKTAIEMRTAQIATAESINASVHEKASELLGVTLAPIDDSIENMQDNQLQEPQQREQESVTEISEEANNADNRK